jgi:hypothetical protein
VELIVDGWMFLAIGHQHLFRESVKAKMKYPDRMTTLLQSPILIFLSLLIRAGTKFKFLWELSGVNCSEWVGHWRRLGP